MQRRFAGPRAKPGPSRSPRDAKLGRPTPIVMSTPAQPASRPYLPGPTGRPVTGLSQPRAAPCRIGGQPACASVFARQTRRAVPTNKAGAGQRRAGQPRETSVADWGRSQIASVFWPLQEALHSRRSGYSVGPAARGHAWCSTWQPVTCSSASAAPALMDPASNQKVLRLPGAPAPGQHLALPAPNCQDLRLIRDGHDCRDLILRWQRRSLAAGHTPSRPWPKPGPPGRQPRPRVACSAIRGASESDEALSLTASPVRVGWVQPLKYMCGRGEGGASALASLCPPPDALRLVNQAVTGKGGTAIGVSVYGLGEHIQVLVTGKNRPCQSWHRDVAETRPVTRCTRPC